MGSFFFSSCFLFFGAKTWESKIPGLTSLKKRYSLAVFLKQYIHVRLNSGNWKNKMREQVQKSNMLSERVKISLSAEMLWHELDPDDEWTHGDEQS